MFRALGHATPPPCRTAETPLQGGSINHMDNFLKAVLLSATSTASRPTTLKRIATTYGTGYDRVLQMARDVPALGAPARPRLRRDRRRNPLCGARGNGPETRRCADAPHRGRRRRPPRRRCVERAAAIMARAHEWDEWRTRNEIAEVEAFYRAAATTERLRAFRERIFIEK